MILLLRQKRNNRGGWELLISRANYQAYIWRQNLMAQQEQLDPVNHGWMHDGEENCLTVKWMKWKPAPDEVIPTFYTEMLFNQVHTLNIILSFICEILLIFFTLFFITDIVIVACECKNRRNETCLCVANDLKYTNMCLCHDCRNCLESLYERRRRNWIRLRWWRWGERMNSCSNRCFNTFYTYMFKWCESVYYFFY